LASEKLELLKKEILQKVSEYGKLKYKTNSFVAKESVIPPSGKVLDENELTHMVDASLDGWLTTGRFNDEFEKKLANFLGVKYLLTTNSGSSANLLAFSALTSDQLGDRAIRPGDEVITVAGGFPTTVNPMMHYGITPVFVDLDLLTHNIDVTQLENAYSPNVKAIMLAHSLGNPFNLKAILDFCKKYNLWLIEDNCDALGSNIMASLQEHSEISVL